MDRPGGAKPPVPAGHVVLIDEIDKAPSDVPNGLLEVLGARSFDIPGIPLRIQAQGNQWPLVVITTNEERELPAAFMHRCMVLTHDAEPEGGYLQFLVDHGLAHFGPGREGGDAVMDETILHTAAAQLNADRLRARTEQLVPPGLAEYLDRPAQDLYRRGTDRPWAGRGAAVAGRRRCKPARPARRVVVRLRQERALRVPPRRPSGRARQQRRLSFCPEVHEPGQCAGGAAPGGRGLAPGRR